MKKSVSDNRKKLVLVCFSGACVENETTASELRLLIEVFRHKYHCAVAVTVPVGVPLRSTGIKGVTRVRSPKSLVNDPRLRLCVFLTPSLFVRDEAFESHLDGTGEVRGTKRLGCIFKPQGGKLITEGTFDIFRSREIEYATAVRSHRDILICVEGVLG